MSSFQDAHSGFFFLGDDASNMISQAFSPGLNDQDMESTLPHKEVPVSDNNVKPDYPKLPLPYVCAACRKSISRKSVLIRHTKFREKNPLAVTFMKKIFVEKSDLRRNIIIHSKTHTMHDCDQCSEIFLRKYDLLKHKKI